MGHRTTESNENMFSLSKYVLQLLYTRLPKDKDVVHTKALKKTKKTTQTKDTENKQKIED